MICKGCLDDIEDEEGGVEGRGEHGHGDEEGHDGVECPEPRQDGLVDSTSRENIVGQESIHCQMCFDVRQGDMLARCVGGSEEKLEGHTLCSLALFYTHSTLNKGKQGTNCL